MVKRPSGNQKVRGSNPTAAMQVEKRKIGHWEGPLKASIRVSYSLPVTSQPGLGG